jgi:hypothetical protein
MARATTRSRTGYVVDGKIPHGMGKRKGRKVYGASAHYWRREMMPLLVAAACVDIAVKESKDASVIYQQIIDAWDRPDCQKLLKENIALPISEIKAWEKAVTGGNEYNSELVLSWGNPRSHR